MQWDDFGIGGGGDLAFSVSSFLYEKCATSDEKIVTDIENLKENDKFNFNDEHQDKMQCD